MNCFGTQIRDDFEALEKIALLFYGDSTGKGISTKATRNVGISTEALTG